MSARYILFAHGGAAAVFPICSIPPVWSQSAPTPPPPRGDIRFDATGRDAQALQEERTEAGGGFVSPGSSFIRIAMSPSGNMVRIRDDASSSSGARTHVTSFVPQRYYEHVQLLLAFRNRHAARPYLCERFHGTSPSSGISECRWRRGPVVVSRADDPVSLRSAHKDATITVCSAGRRVVYTTKATYNSNCAPIGNDLEPRSYCTRVATVWPVERTPPDVLGLLCASITDVVHRNADNTHDMDDVSESNMTGYQAHVETLYPSSGTHGTSVSACDVATAYFASIDPEMGLLHDPLYFPSCAPVAFEHVGGVTYSVASVSSSNDTHNSGTSPSHAAHHMMRCSRLGGHIQRLRHTHYSATLSDTDDSTLMDSISSSSLQSSSRRRIVNRLCDTSSSSCPVSAECWIFDETLVTEGNKTHLDGEIAAAESCLVSGVSLEEALGNAVISVSGDVVRFTPSYITASNDVSKASEPSPTSGPWASVHVSMLGAIATAARNVDLASEDPARCASALHLNATFCSCARCRAVPQDQSLSSTYVASTSYQSSCASTRRVGCIRWALQNIRTIMKLVAFHNSLLDHMSTQQGEMQLTRSVSVMNISKKPLSVPVSVSAHSSSSAAPVLGRSGREEHMVTEQTGDALKDRGGGSRIIETRRSPDCVLTAYDNGAVHAIFSDFSMIDVHPMGDVVTILYPSGFQETVPICRVMDAAVKVKEMQEQKFLGGQAMHRPGSGGDGVPVAMTYSQQDTYAAPWVVEPLRDKLLMILSFRRSASMSPAQREAIARQSQELRVRSEVLNAKVRMLRLTLSSS